MGRKGEELGKNLKGKRKSYLPIIVVLRVLLRQIHTLGMSVSAAKDLERTKKRRAHSRHPNAP